MEIPGDSSELYTLLEYFRDNGKRTGLVTTTYMTHATPAAFGAHEPSRNNKEEIADDYFQQTRPNILFGGGENGMSEIVAGVSGYTVVLDYSGMQGLDTDIETMVSGQFGSYHLPYEYDYFIGTSSGYDTLPHLSEMTVTALDILDNDPDGFFLMVEGGRIDHAGHSNKLEQNIFETLEFENTVQAVVDWAQGRSDTLILVTADHETGGLSVLQNNGQGSFPDVSWSTTGHTGVNIPAYAWGVNADMVYGIMDNTVLFSVATCSNDPVRIDRTIPLYFSSLQAAYSAAVHGDIIQSRAMEFTEDVSVNQNMSVTIRGGYNCDYSNNEGQTILNGTMTISNGTTAIENVQIL
jgi:alkaline phosphatase